MEDIKQLITEAVPANTVRSTQSAITCFGTFLEETKRPPVPSEMINNDEIAVLEESLCNFVISTTRRIL